jgi:hypothetical protein
MTWQNKAPPVIAFSGGVVHLVRAYLQDRGKYDDFVDYVDREWTLAFANKTLSSDEIAVKLPSKLVDCSPTTRFTSCRPFICTNSSDDETPPIDQSQFSYFEMCNRFF